MTSLFCINTSLSVVLCAISTGNTHKKLSAETGSRRISFRLRGLTNNFLWLQSVCVKWNHCFERTICIVHTNPFSQIHSEPLQIHVYTFKWHLESKNNFLHHAFPVNNSLTHIWLKPKRLGTNVLSSTNIQWVEMENIRNFSENIEI